ncbi:MAG: aldo/keto reductase [Bacilli bacterium]
MHNKIIQGCMRIDHISKEKLYLLIKKELELGINFFDHADIYGRKNALTQEQLFGEILLEHPELRSKMIIQTKCGIIPTPDGPYYDSSKAHILAQVEKSLKDLHITYLDYLLIHRPDALMNPKEIAKAFDYLEQSGKVKHFGVSNFNVSQMKYLQKYVHQKLEVNQLQFSMCHTNLIDSEFFTNMDAVENSNANEDLMYYCKENNIVVQAWSPFQYGFFEGVFIDNLKFSELNSKLEELAKKYNTTKNGIAVAWIIKYSDNMMVINGSTNIDRVIGIVNANNICLTNEEWYSLYRLAGNKLP